MAMFHRYVSLPEGNGLCQLELTYKGNMQIRMYRWFPNFLEQINEWCAFFTWEDLQRASNGGKLGEELINGLGVRLFMVIRGYHGKNPNDP